MLEDTDRLAIVCFTSFSCFKFPLLRLAFFLKSLAVHTWGRVDLWNFPKFDIFQYVGSKLWESHCMQERMTTNNNLHGPIWLHLKYTFGAVLTLRDSTSARKRLPPLRDTVVCYFEEFQNQVYHFYISIPYFPTTPKVPKPRVPFCHICVILFLAFKKEGRPPPYHVIYG